MSDALSENMATCISINVSKGGIPKLPINSVAITINGLVGDEHNHQKHYRPEQAVCLQDIEKLEELTREGYPLKAGTTGENLTVRNLNVNQLELGTMLEVGDVVLEISKVRKPCYVLDVISEQLKIDIEGRCGMYARVIHEGSIQVGNQIVIKKPIQQNIPVN